MHKALDGGHWEKAANWAKTAVMVVGCASGLAASAQSSYTIDIYQQGPNVVAQASGAINLTGLTDESVTASPPQGYVDVSPGGNYFLVFPGSYNLYDGFQTSGNVFANDAYTIAASASGTAAGFYQADALLIPSSYISGSQISGEEVWDGTTIGAMGLQDGLETLKWGSGVNGGTYTIDVGTAPEPSTSAFLGLGALALPILAAYRRLSPPAKRR